MERIRLRRAARSAMAATGKSLPPVLVMTDPQRMPVETVLTVALPSGWGIIHRHFGDEAREREGRRLQHHCRQAQLIYLVANDPQLAMKLRADGVHWPEANATRAGLWQGRFRLMTTSWHARHPVHHLPRGVDAAIVSTVFASASPTAGAAMGAIRMRQLALASRTPIYGLGGITARTAERLAGLTGLAGIDGFGIFAKEDGQIQDDP